VIAPRYPSFMLQTSSIGNVGAQSLEQKRLRSKRNWDVCERLTRVSYGLAMGEA